MQAVCSLAAILLLFAALPSAHAITRAESLAIAESYLQCRWRPSAKNLLHGKDASGVVVHTPDRASGHGSPPENCWKPEVENTGVAYKWGGYDTPASFLRGIAAGKAAGDVYTSEKRRLNDHGVSAQAVGIDCSGFVSRCWKTPRRYSTSTLESITRRLTSAAELRRADVMNQAGGHVLFFVKWLDPEKKRALFYEAAPFSKTLASERDVAEIGARGFLPLRFREMRD